MGPLGTPRSEAEAQRTARMTINDSSRGLAVDAHHQQPTPQIMSTPPTPTRIRREDRDTGFPEPFGDSK